MTDLCVSFSGGETSAYMAQLAKTKMRDEFDEIHFIFANTGQEDDRTLDFVDRVDKHFSLGVHWVEAVTHLRERKSCTHRIVDYATASRSGEPFRGVIEKYGIPGPGVPFCTRELKGNPIRDFIRNGLGLKRGGYKEAIGIRADEFDRMSPKAAEFGFIYPLVSPYPTTKPQINSWWRDQPFRLGLKEYEGNCVWCWKKSLRKHMWLMKTQPSAFDFPEQMEKTHAQTGITTPADGAAPDRRYFFRNHMTVNDLRSMAEHMPDGILEPTDGNQVFDYQLDLFSGCEESCEITPEDFEGENV